jgi:23S rRNA (uracil1939-C5)-methyltransferase
VAEKCGGCDWQHISSTAQARLKVDMVRDALRRTGAIEFSALEIETGSSWNYRNRLQVHADGSGSVGFLERGGHGFVPVKNCPVAHPAFASLFSGGCRTDAPTRFHAFAAADANGTPRLWREDSDPETEIRIDLLGKSLAFPVKAFFQSNLEMLGRLIPFALEGLRGKSAWDLYAGVGVFGAMLQAKFERVLCVESDANALAFARRNLKAEGSGFLEGRLEDFVNLPRGPLAGECPEAVVVDPPREGLDSGVRRFLAQRGSPRLIYVSCNPVTLARDLKDLLAGPYALEDLRLFDFYPQTSHVEAVAKLRMRETGGN